MTFGDKVEPFMWGAAAGAAVLALIGFNAGGWVTGGTAKAQGQASAQEAVVASLTPICVAQFRKDPDAKARLAALKETDSWKQGGYVSEAGWAKMPGANTESDSEVAQACAEAIVKLKL